MLFPIGFTLQELQNDELVDVLVARIRRKLGTHACLLRTMRGVGYLFGELE